MANQLIEITIPEQRVFYEINFPLALAPPNNIQNLENVLHYLKTNKDELLNKLVAHGAILFRGFPIKTPSDFNEFVLSFGWKDMPYVGGIAFRTNIIGAVHTANESPHDQPIFHHHEMIYLPKYPSHVFFYCDLPPKADGETPICLSNFVYEKVNKEIPEFVQNLKEKGIKYTRVMPLEDDPTSGVGRSWQNSFKTSDRSQVEAICKGIYEKIEWLPDGSLKTISFIFPGVKLEERTGKYTWFNQIVAAYFAWRDSRNHPDKVVTYGDDSSIEPSHIERANEILKESSVSFKWQYGDILLIDNLLVLHARNSYTPPRRILAALFQ